MSRRAVSSVILALILLGVHPSSPLGVSEEFRVDPTTSSDGLVVAPVCALGARHVAVCALAGLEDAADAEDAKKSGADSGDEKGDRDRDEWRRRQRERWERMSPEERDALRRVYERLRSLPESEREGFLQKLRGMNDDERREFLDRASREASGSPDPLSNQREQVLGDLWSRLSDEEQEKLRSMTDEERRSFFRDRFDARRRELISQLPPELHEPVRALDGEVQAEFLRLFRTVQQARITFRDPAEVTHLRGLERHAAYEAMLPHWHRSPGWKPRSPDGSAGRSEDRRRRGPPDAGTESIERRPPGERELPREGAEPSDEDGSNDDPRERSRSPRRRSEPREASRPDGEDPGIEERGPRRPEPREAGRPEGEPGRPAGEPSAERGRRGPREGWERGPWEAPPPRPRPEFLSEATWTRWNELHGFEKARVLGVVLDSAPWPPADPTPEDAIRECEKRKSFRRGGPRRPPSPESRDAENRDAKSRGPEKNSRTEKDGDTEKDAEAVPDTPRPADAQPR